MTMDEDDSSAGAPEWALTFGDMMSLLLTFFIMLASLSEVKEQEKYQALVDSVHRQFGHNLADNGMVPGWTRPRHSVMARLVTTGRARKYDFLSGDSRAGTTGPNTAVKMTRDGERLPIGAVIFFEDSAVELTEVDRRELRELARQFAEKTQKIEIRGHASPRASSEFASYIDSWELAYSRARTTMKYLVEQLGIDAQRIRVAVAGENEPLQGPLADGTAGRNDRVEVFLLNEMQEELGREENGVTRTAVKRQSPLVQ